MLLSLVYDVFFACLPQNKFFTKHGGVPIGVLLLLSRHLGSTLDDTRFFGFTLFWCRSLSLCIYTTCTSSSLHPQKYNFKHILCNQKSIKFLYNKFDTSIFLFKTAACCCRRAQVRHIPCELMVSSFKWTREMMMMLIDVMVKNFAPFFTIFHSERYLNQSLRLKHLVRAKRTWGHTEGSKLSDGVLHSCWALRCVSCGSERTAWNRPLHRDVHLVVSTMRSCVSPSVYPRKTT